MSFSRWMDKLWFFHIAEYQSGIKKKKKKSYQAAEMHDGPWNSLVKEASQGGHTLFDFSFIPFWKRLNYIASKMISGFQGLRWKRGGGDE